MTSEERITAWFNGDLEDEDLTREDVRQLDDRVMAAVARKILERQGVHTFPQHKTMQ